MANKTDILTQLKYKDQNQFNEAFLGLLIDATSQICALKHLIALNVADKSDGFSYEEVIKKINELAEQSKLNTAAELINRTQ